MSKNIQAALITLGLILSYAVTVVALNLLTSHQVGVAILIVGGGWLAFQLFKWVKNSL